MTGSEDYYRQQLEESERQAQKAISEHEKAVWLRVAEGWRALLRYRREPTAETFDEMADRLGSGQEIDRGEQ